MNTTNIYQPITPMPELSAWSAELRQIARQPLQFCADFPTIAKRLDAWWAHDVLDRPVFTGAANTNSARPAGRRYELLGDLDAWFEAKYADMLQLHRVGETLPHIRVQVPALGGVLGAKTEFTSDTSWTYPTIADDWSDAPEWRLDEDNHWWRLMRKVARLVGQDARGRYLVMSPGAGVGGDLLEGMRGAKQLCLDLIEQPERILAATEAIYSVWHRIFAETYRIPVEEGAGVIQNVGLWSNRPYDVPQSDFSFMISTRHFRQVFMPEIVRIAATVGRAVFHLDGPGVARHIDAVLEIPDIQAIQWVPGAGTPSPLPWIEMLCKIQRRGRSLQVVCPPEDVLPLCDALRPEGLAIAVGGALTPVELDELFERFCRQYS